MDNYDPSMNYIEMLEELWKDKKTGNSSGYSDCLTYNRESQEWKNEVSYKLVVATIGARLRQQQAYQKICDDIDAKVNGKKGTINMWFITVCFSEELFTVEKFKEWWSKMTGKAIIYTVQGVIERHSESGVNTHCHIILGVPYQKGRVTQFIWESAGTKKLIGGKNFIDVKPYVIERHKHYVLGDKKPEKMENVEKDKEWRKKLNLPDFLSKGKI